MSDDIGDRFKAYEACWDYALPRRLPLVIRVDGRGFHSLPLSKPFDEVFWDNMSKTALALCEEIQGARLAYFQSDEISVIARDDMSLQSEAWFGKRLQKMVSIAASVAAVNFNHAKRFKLGKVYRDVEFDARAFVLPDLTEVENYLIWRQQDATRNSVSMAARAVYSHKQCNDKNTPQLLDMLHAADKPWNAVETRFKRGAVAKRVVVTKPIPRGPKAGENCERREWQIDTEAPVFTADRNYLRLLLEVPA